MFEKTGTQTKVQSMLILLPCEPVSHHCLLLNVSGEVFFLFLSFSLSLFLSFFLSFFPSFFFFDRVSLYSLDCPGNYFVVCRPGWPQLRNPPASASQVLGLKACASTARQGGIFLSAVFFIHFDAFGSCFEKLGSRDPSQGIICIS